jgi:hypothetical protein
LLCHPGNHASSAIAIASSTTREPAIARRSIDPPVARARIPRKVFRSVVPRPDPQDRFPSNLHPIQSLIWSDYEWLEKACEAMAPRLNQIPCVPVVGSSVVTVISVPSIRSRA